MQQAETVLAPYNAADYVALQSGSTLGPYEILSLIGAGEMGEVCARAKRRCANAGYSEASNSARHSHDRPAIARMNVIRSFRGT